MQDNALTIEQILTRFVICFEPFYKRLYTVQNTILFVHQWRPETMPFKLITKYIGLVKIVKPM